MNTNINDRIELSTLETGDLLESPDVFYATALTTVTLPNDNSGLTNHPKGSRVQITKEEAIKRFGEAQVTKLVAKFEKHKSKVELKEVIQSADGRYFAT